MFLSVVIATYNRKDSLRVTLDGLARQDWPASAFEVLVVSDGSTDGTDAFVNAYPAPYALTLLTQPNSGPACARNRGIEAARGDVVVFLDDDVEPVPGCLTAHARRHMSDGNAVVIGPLSPDPARQGAEPSWIAWEHAMLQKQYTAWRTGAWTEIGPPNFYSGNASVRREQLLAVGGFDEAFTRQEDVELAWRLARRFAPTFMFNADADGLHRPRRTFASWLAVPYAYGRLDVVRARRGDASWQLVRDGFHTRRRVTQTLARAVLRLPALAGPLNGGLRAASALAYPLGARRASLAALSVLYNLRYLQGAADEMGQGELRRLLYGPHAPAENPCKEAA